MCKIQTTEIIRVNYNKKKVSRSSSEPHKWANWILSKGDDENDEEDDDIDLGEDDFEESNAEITVDSFTTKTGRPVQFGTDEYFENTKEKQGAKVELDPRYI